MEGVSSLYQEKEEKGAAVIKKFTVGEEAARRYNFHSAIRTGSMVERIEAGNYVKLEIDGEVFMSDTPMEKRTNFDFVEHANGRVFIAGLGIGLIVHNILKKKNVKEVVVMEISSDVIDLVAPKFAHDKRVKIVQGDVLEWKPNKGELFDTIYFDIWYDVSARNYEQMKKLHKNFKYNLNRKNQNAFMSSWRKDTTVAMVREDKRSRWGRW